MFGKTFIYQLQKKEESDEEDYEGGFGLFDEE
jgi:ribosomal protein L12E/L44/L45/RPP1/RPP2